MKHLFLRLIFINRRLQLIILLLLTILLYYYNILAVNNLSPVPIPRTTCDIDSAKYLIKSLVCIKSLVI